MKNLIIILGIIFLSCSNVIASPKAKITAKIIDEEGNMVEGARVTLSFSGANFSGGGGIRNYSIKGVSDEKGLFTGSRDTLSLVGIVADKEGYYRSIKKFEFTSHSKLLNRWEPWNPRIEVLLKKKRNPVPMYMGYLKAANIPVLGSPVGFDLEKRDWVFPYGKGIVEDLIFLCQNKYESFTSAETSCDISFSTPWDGFQKYEFNQNDQSLYRWPYEAPSSGYDIKKMTKWMSVHLPAEQYKSNSVDSINYIFRVRTVVDKDGNVVTANYGKIKGDFRVYKKAQINFAYFFNPDGTRNLEEDPEQNLFEKK